MKLPKFRITSTPMVKNIATLVAGNAIAMGIPIIIYPLLSRLFTPEDYALFGLYFSLFTFIEIGSAGRYDLAIVIPEEEDDAIQLMVGGFVIATTYSLMVLFILLVFRNLVASILGNPALSTWLPFIPLSLLLISISKLVGGWLLRQKKFKAASVNKTSQKLSEGAAQLSIGFLSNSNGLVIGDLIGRFFHTCFSIYQAIRNGFSMRTVSRHRVVGLLVKYSEFPKFGIVPSMLNALGGMLPVFVISSFYRDEISGSFNFSRLVLALPFALVATGVSQVIMQQVAERKNNNETITKDIFNLAIKLFIGTFVILSPLFFFAPELFVLVFGSKWKTAGEFSSILAWPIAISFVTSSFSSILIVLRKVKWLSLWQVFYFVIISSLWFFREFTITRLLQIMVLLDVFLYSIYAGVILLAVKDYEKQIVKEQDNV